MCLRQTRPARATGFTLIELLVVVSIIALLISILLPSLKNARKQTQAVACAANLKSITTALFMYQTDSREWLPHNLWSEWDWGVPKWDLWFYKLFPMYVNDGELFICAGDPFRSQFDFEAKPLGPDANDPELKVITVPSCGYGLSYVFRHWREPYSFNVGQYAPRRPRSTILFAEVGPDGEMEETPLGSVPGGRGLPWRDGGRLLWDDGARPWYSGPTWLTARHAGSINMAALDGHVQRARTKHMLNQRIMRYYEDCERGDCYFCGTDPRYGRRRDPHYNFAHADLYWWTGPYPLYPGTEGYK